MLVTLQVEKLQIQDKTFIIKQTVRARRLIRAILLIEIKQVQILDRDIKVQGLHSLLHLE
jgi:hypothetical protein